MAANIAQRSMPHEQASSSSSSASSHRCDDQLEEALRCPTLSRRRVEKKTSDWINCVEAAWRDDLDRAAYQRALSRRCRHASGQACRNMFFDERTKCWQPLATGDDVDLTGFGDEEDDRRKLPKQPPPRSSTLSSTLKREFADVERAHDQHIALFFQGTQPGTLERYVSNATLAFNSADDWLRAGTR